MEKSTTNLDFLKRKNINNSKANTDNPSMTTSSVDIPISEILKQNFEKSKSMKLKSDIWYSVNIE
jgi:hypothetical protein